MTRRKDRQVARRDAEEELYAPVAEAVARYLGARSEKELAGDWNSLGLRVDLPADATDGTVFELGNELLAILQAGTAELQPPFTWTLGIYRADELLRVLAPGDKPHRRCPACGYEQRWTERCYACEHPFRGAGAAPAGE